MGRLSKKELDAVFAAGLEEWNFGKNPSSDVSDKFWREAVEWGAWVALRGLKDKDIWTDCIEEATKSKAA